MALFSVVLALAAPAQWFGLQLASAPVAVVHARALRVAPSTPGSHIGTFVIEHVYAGAPSLQGQTFEVHSESFGFTVTRLLHLPLRQGEEGIWSLRRDKASKQLRGYIPDTWGESPISSRKVIEPDGEARERLTVVSYNAVRRWAEAVERAERRDPPGRLVQLMQDSRSQQALIAAWAIRQLADSKREGDLAFLTQLATQRDLPLASQVVLDEALARRRGAAWTGSPERRALLEGWVSGAIESDQHARRVLRRLGDAIGKHELDLPTAVRLIGLWQIHQPMSASFKAELFEFQGYHLLSDESRPTTTKILFDLAVQQLREAKNSGARVGAAQLLREITPLTSDQRATVRALLRESKEPRVVQALRYALEASQNSKQ